MAGNRRLTMWQASAYTGLSITRLRKLVETDGVPHKKTRGGEVEFETSSLDAWLDAQNIQSGSRADDERG